MRDVRICLQCEHHLEDLCSGVKVYKCPFGDTIAGALGDQAARPVPEKCPCFFEHVVKMQGHERDAGYGTPQDVKDMRGCSSDG